MILGAFLGSMIGTVIVSLVAWLFLPWPPWLKKIKAIEEAIKTLRTDAMGEITRIESRFNTDRVTKIMLIRIQNAGEFYFLAGDKFRIPGKINNSPWVLTREEGFNNKAYLAGNGYSIPLKATFGSDASDKISRDFFDECPGIEILELVN